MPNLDHQLLVPPLESLIVLVAAEGGRAGAWLVAGRALASPATA